MFLALGVGSMQVAWLLLTAGQIALLARLWHQKLLSTYKFFSLYLLADLLHSGVLYLLGNPNTEIYAWFYVASEPVLATLRVLVLVELYRLVLRDYAGLATFGRWALTASLAASFVIGFLSVYPHLGSTDPYPVLLSLSHFQRLVYSALLLFILFISGFLIWFPVPLSRNTVVHTVLFAVYFSVSAVLVLLRFVAGPEIIRLLSTIWLAGRGLCILGWVFLLTRKGEKKSVVFGHQWRPHDGEQLIGQLQAINAVLLRAARK